MDDNYYSILKIAQNATQRDIKVAYRKLVQAHHPDVNKSGNDDLIKIINGAYETLSDPVKRAQYDNRFQANYSASTPSSYSPPRSSRQRPPQSYNRGTTGSTQYTYSTKTKVLGWSLTIIAIGLIALIIISLHYFASGYYYDQGLAAEKNNNLNEAIYNYQLAIRDWGSMSVESAIRAAEINNKMGAFYLMAEFCELGFEYDPDSVQSAQLYYLEGKSYYLTKNYKQSEIAFTKSLEFNYNKDTIYYNLGALYFNHLNNYDKAEKIYTYLLASNSLDVSNYYKRGICYQNLGKHQEAIYDFLTVLEDNPFNGKTLFQIGRSYLALGQKEKACYYLRFSQNQSINIDPEDLAKACD